MTTQFQDLPLTGPIKFLGATVLSFNGSLGIGSQESTLTVELVEDCEAGDSFGFGLPDQLIGSPAYFPSVANGMAFSFNGIVTNWTTNDNTSGKTYSVTLTDPRRLLENYTLIIDTYSGSGLSNVPNLFNVYNYYESQEQILNGNCSSFGSSSVIDERGMPYQKILDAITSNNLTIYTPTGQQLYINLSNLTATLPYSYRANGPAISLLQVITDVAEATGFDFYVYLQTDNTIRVGLIDLRQNPTSFSYIQNLSGTITDRSFGRELRIEKQNTIIFGEKVHYMAYANSFLPYFGENDSCQPITAEPAGACGFRVLTNTTPLAASMRYPGVFAMAGYLYIYEFDLRANYELWKEYILNTDPSELSPFAQTAKAWFNNNGITGNFAGAFQDAENGILPAAKNRSAATMTASNMSKSTSKVTQEHINEDAKKIHGLLESLRQTFYGKQFLCVLNQNICSVNTSDIVDSGNSAPTGNCLGTAKAYSAVPTNDGAWVDNGGSVMGVGDPYLGFFRQEDGRVGSFALFSSGNVGIGRKLNLENISADEVLVNPNGNQAYVKAELGEKLYKISNKTYVLIKFSDACLTTLTDTEANFPAAFMALGQAVQKTALVSGSGGGGSPITTTQSPGAQSIENAPTILSNTQYNQASYVCGLPTANAVAAVGNLDVSALNKYQLIPSAVMPSVAAIPMRSNILTYGPYVSPNFGLNTGGCQAEVNTDLAPWVFGSSSRMDIAGNALATSSQMGLNQSETGSLNIVGLPNLPYMGTVSGGPNLTGINVNFSASGISTSYNFQTFTPRFGDLAKVAVEQMKTNARNRQKQLQFLRNQAITAYNINRKLTRIKSNSVKEKQKNVADGSTLHRCLIGDMYDWYDQESGPSQRTEVGMDSYSKSVLELRYDYAKKAFMSLDGLFGPVSKFGGAGNLPRYCEYDNQSVILQFNKTKSSPLCAQPPFSINPIGQFFPLEEYNLAIDQQHLDPLTNNVSDTNHHHEGFGAGHAIDVVGRGAEPSDFSMFTNAHGVDDNSKYSQDYRFLGLRGPLVLHSWGYDLDGKPIPNDSDSDINAGQGSFTKENLKDKFLQDWLNKPKTWPVAPVDLRFDRQRGMWVSPQPYKIVVAKLTEALEPNSFVKAQLINEDTENAKTYGITLYDTDGNEIDATNNGEAFIRVADRIGQSHEADAMVYAYYDSYASEYIILSGGASSSIIYGKAVNTFKPTDADGIEVEIIPAVVTPNGNKKITNIQNPMGYGAEKDDKVILTKIKTSSDGNSGGSGSEAEYMVIGTGEPPKDGCGGGNPPPTGV